MEKREGKGLKPVLPKKSDELLAKIAETLDRKSEVERPYLNEQLVQGLKEAILKGN